MCLKGSTNYAQTFTDSPGVPPAVLLQLLYKAVQKLLFVEHAVFFTHTYFSLSDLASTSRKKNIMFNLL